MKFIIVREWPQANPILIASMIEKCSAVRWSCRFWSHQQLTTGVWELPKVDEESCDDTTGLLLDVGLVWVGDGMVESGGEVGWIAELLESSEDWMEAGVVVAWVPLQLPSAAVLVVGQLTIKHAASQKPGVRSPQVFSKSETITPGICSSSDTIAPLSMSLKTLTTSVTAASATLTIWVGKLKKMPTTVEKALMTSCGRSWMIVGTWPFWNSSTNFWASPASGF